MPGAVVFAVRHGGGRVRTCLLYTSSYEKFGERFVNRILYADEIAYCLSHKNPAPFLAVRFSAKEAISKAFGTGICAQLGWQDMEIRRKESGEPFVVLHGKRCV